MPPRHDARATARGRPAPRVRGAVRRAATRGPRSHKVTSWARRISVTGNHVEVSMRDGLSCGDACVSPRL